MNDEYNELTSIRKTFCDYRESLDNRENGNIAGAKFIDAVEKILEEFYESRSI